MQVADAVNATVELQLIKKSLVRVVALSCEGRHAKTVLRQAHEAGLLKESFIWIVTDGITGSSEELAYNGAFPSYYNGLIGIGEPGF